MPQVHINAKRVWVGEQPHALLSGEVHYWRMNPRLWPEVLRRVREMGLEGVASYVCWEHHEIAPGRFDFRGETAPERDLTGFLEMVAAEGLWLLLRPGPYIYSEWRNGGLPDRAARYHRLHPEYRAAASDYMAAATEAILPYLATRGGPVILFQAENEPDPWPHIYEGQLGLGQTPGLFQDYLRERYGGDLAALNTAWEADLQRFEQARAVLQPVIPGRGYLNRYLDFCRFRMWCTAEAVRWTVEGYRTLGVDVPILVNTYTNFGIQNWRELEELADIAGPDLYPADGFRLRPEELRQFLHVLRYTRSYSALPYIPEFEAGIWHGGLDYTGSITPGHYLLAACAALLGGAAGWNWYMLANRDNWLLSPINELGRPRPELFEVFQRIVALFRAIDPPALEKLCATAVTVDPLHQTARRQAGDGRLIDGSDRLLDALLAADIDYDCCDVETGQVTRSLLLYAGGDWLSAAAQERLLAYVEGGGTLVFFQDLPVRDETLSPLNRLGLRLPERILGAGYPQRLAVHLGDGEPVTLSSPAFFAYGDVPGEPIVAERIPDAPPAGDELALHINLLVGTSYIVGYRQRRGAGSIICLGLAPGPELLVALHRWLDVPLYSRARTPGVVTALFQAGETRVVIALNLSDEDRDAAVWLHPAPFAGGAWCAHDLLGGEALLVDPQSPETLFVHLPARSGTVVRLEKETPA
ncbi:MAG: hypothetical protein HPY64_02320 [Anaerolineae bacterium]|nr:hypothetical protein [Anaerolineae bacterium]